MTEFQETTTQRLRFKKHIEIIQKHSLHTIPYLFPHHLFRHIYSFFNRTYFFPCYYDIQLFIWLLIKYLHMLNLSLQDLFIPMFFIYIFSFFLQDLSIQPLFIFIGLIFSPVIYLHIFILFLIGLISLSFMHFYTFFPSFLFIYIFFLFKN